MVQLNYDDSSSKVIKAAERHLHLCEQNENAHSYRDSILPLLENLRTRHEERLQADRAVTFATDNIYMSDSRLDNEVRRISRRCKTYDMDNPGNKTLDIVFPGGVFSPIVSLPLTQEPDAVEQLLNRLESLGEEHELYPLAQPVYSFIEDCRNAFTNREALIAAASQARTAEDIAKMSVIRQYNANYFAAAHDIDKYYAENLYPRFKHSEKETADIDPVENEEI